MSKLHLDGITRRSALLGIAAAATLPAKSWALESYPYPYTRKLGVMSGGPLKAVDLQGVTFNVPNLERGLDFYQSLYGLRIQNWQGKSPILRIGNGRTSSKWLKQPDGPILNVRSSPFRTSTSTA